MRIVDGFEEPEQDVLLEEMEDVDAVESEEVWRERVLGGLVGFEASDVLVGAALVEW